MRFYVNGDVFTVAAGEVIFLPGQKPHAFIVTTQRLTENELSDFSRLCHDGCVEAIIESQDVDRNHSTEV